MKLIPVKYHNKSYPDSVVPLLDEVAGNLDSKQISMHMPYSLHTEYSYMKRNLDSALVSDLEELKAATKNGIPQLWKSAKWSEQYALFIKRLIGDSIAPEVIEIHPPFRDYCESLETFWERYMVFFDCISAQYPNTKIIMENRCGTMYAGAPFLFSTCDDILRLCKFLAKGHTELGVIVDYPQLFSAEKIRMDHIVPDKILCFNECLRPYANSVDAIHLWGKRKGENSNRWSPHTGDLNTFFGNDMETKELFLASMQNAFCDEKARYFVPEVNSSEEDLKSIVNDLLKAGVIFVQKEHKEYLVAIGWDTETPQFVMYDIPQKEVKKYDAIGLFDIIVGEKKYCVGNKDVVSHEYIGCPNGAEVDRNASKCPECDNSDKLKYCVRCTGKQCFVKDNAALSRCAHEHFVYLAFFPDSTVKVGVSHGRRKYARLLEQGALYSYLIASCRSGKEARQLEDEIKSMGIKDKVTSGFKIHNLKPFDINYAEGILSKTYHSILEQLDHIGSEKVHLIQAPEIYVQSNTLLMLAEVLKKGARQLTLWDLLGTDVVANDSIEILDSMTTFRGEIVMLIGSIGVLKKENQYFLYDFKKLYGQEISVKRI